MDIHQAADLAMALAQEAKQEDMRLNYRVKQAANKYVWCVLESTWEGELIQIWTDPETSFPVAAP